MLNLLQGLKPEVDRNLLLVAQSLKALDIPFRISAVELVEPTTTAMQIGSPLKPFAVRYEGHHEAFSDLLREIEVPLSVRLRYPRGVGLSALTPEKVQELHINDTRLRYPGFMKAIEAAYDRSLADLRDPNAPIGVRPPALNPTPLERLRTDGNLAAVERLGEFVDEFNHRRSDLSSVSLRITKNGEEPAILSAGPLHDSPPDHIVLVRRAVLGEFGGFLRAEFFNRQ
ncbi:MAG: hypothetical protein RL417_2189 [Pseudomonadota bacterium]